MTNEHIAVCFTGRRPRDLFGYASHKAYMPLRARLEKAIEQFIDTEDVDTFISGGAQGVDQLAFWAVENVKKRRPSIRNVVYVPFKGQERRWKTAGEESIPLEDFVESMKGIYTTSVCPSTLDESPFAYKNADSIRERIGETARIERTLKPIYNFKAHRRDEGEWLATHMKRRSLPLPVPSLYVL